MKWLSYALIIFVLEFIFSWLSEKRSLSVITRKRWSAALLDLAASSINWVLPWIIMIQERDATLIPFAVIASAIGSYIVAARKPTKRLTTKKKRRELREGQCQAFTSTTDATGKSKSRFKKSKAMADATAQDASRMSSMKTGLPVCQSQPSVELERSRLPSPTPVS